MNKRKFTYALALAVAISAASAVSCGDGGSGETAGGVSINASQKTADLKITFDFPEYKAVEPEAQAFEFKFFDDDQRLCYSRTAQRGEFKNSSIILSKVPVEAKSLVCLLKDKYTNPVGLTESLALDLIPGAEVSIVNPDYASTAAELGERLSALSITSDTPVTLNVGEKTSFKVEGTFCCRNGVELPCELTDCTRLVWESSNNSVLRSLGQGRFKALSAGSVKIYASIGQKQVEGDVIVKAVPESGQLKPEPEDGDTDPTTITDPEPAPVETPCTLSYDLSKAELPAGLTLEVRGYDANNILRFRRENASLTETLEDVDQSVTKLAGVMLKNDGQVHGILLADVNLKNQKNCSVSDPEIITGAALAGRGEMIITSDKAVYDLSDYEIYNKTDKNDRCVKVSTSAEVRYNVIPGVWGYVSGGDFLEEYCSFDADGADMEDFGVFRFFEAGEYTVSVSYRGVTGVFSVTVTDSSSPVDDYKLNIDLSTLGLPSGVNYDVRGYNSSNSLLFSQSNVSNLNSTFEGVDKNITKLIGVIKASNGEPYAMFTQSVSLVSGQVCRVSSPTLLSGKQFAEQKGSLSFSIATTSYDLKNKNSSGYVTISTSPSLTYNYGNGWTATFSRSDLLSWNDFALNSSPYLEYTSYKYELKAYEENSYSIYASYRGLTSSTVSVTVIDTTPVPSKVNVNFASSGLPADSSIIYCQFYKDGTAVSEEFSKSSASSLSFDDISPEANGMTFIVKNASGQLTGLLYKSLSFDSNHTATLSSVSVAAGSGMNSYIKSFTASPGDSLKTVGTYLTGSAQAELTFNSGRILQTRNVSTEAVWSSSDMTQGTANNSWRVTRAGESSLRAALGGNYVDLKAYASGTYNGNVYQYGEANLNSKKAVAMAVYAPGDTSSKGSFSGKVVGGTPSGTNQSAVSADEGLKKPVDDGEQAELDIRALEAEEFAKVKQNSSDSHICFDTSENYTKTIDYLNAKTGDTISNLYNHQTKTYYDAKVVLGVDGITLGSYRTSGKIIILSQIVDGQPLIDMTDMTNKLKVLEIDYIMAKKNPFDSQGKSVLDRLRQDIGHECGYGVGGGISGTEKVVISIVDFGSTNVNAYTIASNSFPRSLMSTSNEAEMITFNHQRYANWDVPSMCSNFAHEWGHMASFNSRALRDMENGYIAAANNYTNREDDLEEGHSDLCSLLCGFCCDDRTGDFSEFESAVGYNLSGRIWKSYYEKADDRRTKSANYLREISSYSIKDSQYGSSSVVANYGQGFFFVAYMYDRFGLNAVNNFYNSSYLDSAYQSLPYESDKKDYDLLAYIISGNTKSFSEIFQDYGKALLLNSTNETNNIPVNYRLYSIKPGQTNNTEISDVVWAGYDNNTVLPNITPGNFSSGLSASNIVPWSLNYYVTPNMTYSIGTSSSVFGLWGGLNNIFKLMRFTNGYAYEGDIN